jgi:hypothetical protein
MSAEVSAADIKLNFEPRTGISTNCWMPNDENYESSYHHELCSSDSISNSSSTSSKRRFWKARRTHFL